MKKKKNENINFKGGLCEPNHEPCEVSIEKSEIGYGMWWLLDIVYKFGKVNNLVKLFVQ